MMLVTSVFTLLAIAAIVAIAVMIGTWRQYGGAWAALDTRPARDPLSLYRGDAA